MRQGGCRQLAPKRQVSSKHQVGPVHQLDPEYTGPGRGRESSERREIKMSHDQHGPAQPIRLTLITTELAVGGAERCLVNLAAGLQRCGQFEPQVVSLAPPPSSGRDALVRQLQQTRIPTHFLGLTSPRQAFTAVIRLRRLLRQQRPHVVQTFLHHANIVGAVAARTAGISTVVSGIRVADPRRGRHLAERVIAGRVRRIVCVSQDVADFCRDVARMPADKLLVIPNGIDLSRYENVHPADLTQFGLPPDGSALLCVGRLDHQKGLDWLLPTLQTLLQQRPRLHLLLVGDGTQREQLRRLAESLEVSAQVHFTGWRPDVAELMAASSVLLLPSRWEGMPNVVLEAMAAGRPVLGARVSGVAELLGPQAETEAFEPENSEDFLQKLVGLLDDQPRAQRLGAANRQRVRNHFSLESMWTSYARLYQSLIGPK